MLACFRACVHDRCLLICFISVEFGWLVQVIFDVLYLLITFGHAQGKNGSLESLIDPIVDTFRVRLVCCLLETCGQYFDTGSAKRRLETFLLYFQRYILLKQFVPIDVEFMVADLFDHFLPNSPRFASLSEANTKIEELEKKVSGTDATDAYAAGLAGLA